MTTNTEAKSYVYPDPVMRRRAMVLAVLAGLCVLAVGLLLHSVVRPWLDHYLSELQELAKHDLQAARRSLLNLMALIFAVNGSLVFGLGIWMIRTGWQMTRAERWPPPRMRVYRRVKILDGKTARRRGRVLVGLGLIMAILAPALVWNVYRASSALFNELRPNVNPTEEKPH